MSRLRLFIAIVASSLVVGFLSLLPASASNDPGYAFFFTNSNGRPVGSDRCRAHPVIINPSQGTPRMISAIKAALPEISRQTGYHFFFAGITNLPWNGPAAPGEQFTTAPIRIGFSAAAKTPQLAGATAGWTSVSQVTRNGKVELGRVRMVLDSADFKKLTRRGARMKGPKGRGSVSYATWFRQSLLPHEFGHVLGLSHTSNRNQLMSPRVTAFGFQPGDLAGIARLRSQSCSG